MKRSARLNAILDRYGRSRRREAMLRLILAYESEQLTQQSSRARRLTHDHPDSIWARGRSPCG